MLIVRRNPELELRLHPAAMAQRVERSIAQGTGSYVFGSTKDWVEAALGIRSQ